MKQLLTLAFLIVLLSCGKNKSVLLPEIQDAKITAVKDVSPVYIFYDETKQDSVDFNRKNMISTTNWLVNIDKRLTLKQVLPYLNQLQNKRKKAGMHKNENARNYFTCNDTIIKNLGFIDFTDVVYNVNSSISDPLKIALKKEPTLLLELKKDKTIKAHDLYAGKIISRGYFNKEKPQTPLISYEKIIFLINDDVTFQDYISFKQLINQTKSEKIKLKKTEFFY